MRPWGKEQEQFKGYCSSPGEGCQRLGRGSRGGGGDSEISYHAALGDSEVSGSEAGMCHVSKMKTVEIRGDFLALFPLSQPLILELNKESSVLGT